MADIEQFTEEQAQKLLEESYPGAKPEVVSTTPPIPALETPAEPEKTEVEQEAPKGPAAATEVEGATGATGTAEPAKPDATKPPAVAEDNYKWLEALPEDARERVQAEIDRRLQVEHQERSSRGRIAAYQKQILEAQRKIANQPATQPAPAERQTPQTPENWQEVVKSDPELAKAIEAHVKSEVESAVQSVRTDLQELRKTAIDPLYENQEQQYVETQRQELERMVPNVHEVISSPQYAEWLKSASQGIRNLALTSTDAQDAIVVLRQYADDMVRTGRARPQPAPSTVTPPTSVDTTEADKIAAERDRKLKAQTVVPSAPIAPVAGTRNGPVTSEDAEKIFLEAYNKFMKPKT